MANVFEAKPEIGYHPDPRRGGISFIQALALLFIGLKLGGVIGWGWIAVLSPLWVPLALLAGFYAAVILIALLVTLAELIREKRTRRAAEAGKP